MCKQLLYRKKACSAKYSVLPKAFVYGPAMMKKQASSKALGQKSIRGIGSSNTCIIGNKT